MTEFAILTNRKRALIALIHSVVFLGVAVHGFMSPKLGLLQGSASSSARPNADYILAMIYMTVAAVLAWLVSISRGWRERIYFALCTCSASFGLLRVVIGDPSLPIAQYMRVLMLTSAVALCSWILRAYSTSAAPDVAAD
jgi:hypothetical protein